MPSGAELVRESCPVCAGLVEHDLRRSGHRQVDAAVAQAFAGFSPVAGRRRGWLAAAAAAVLAVGIGTTMMVWRGGETAPVVAEQSPAAEAVLSAWDFEDGELAQARGGHSRPTRRPGDTDEAVFVNDLESGDLGSWTFHS